MAVPHDVMRLGRFARRQGVARSRPFVVQGKPFATQGKQGCRRYQVFACALTAESKGEPTLPGSRTRPGFTG
jgi:hypothetical protein